MPTLIDIRYNLVKTFYYFLHHHWIRARFWKSTCPVGKWPLNTKASLSSQYVGWRVKMLCSLALSEMPGQPVLCACTLCNPFKSGPHLNHPVKCGHTPRPKEMTQKEFEMCFLSERFLLIAQPCSIDFCSISFYFSLWEFIFSLTDSDCWWVNSEHERLIIISQSLLEALGVTLLDMDRWQNKNLY